MELSKVIDEIKLIPPDRLSEVYSFIHFFRLGLESSLDEDHAQELHSEQGIPSTAAKYDFSDLAGRLTWQGDALKTQRSLRDEW